MNISRGGKVNFYYYCKKKEKNMKVKLINVAEYELKDGKTTEMPFETFVNLCGNVGVETN